MLASLYIGLANDVRLGLRAGPITGFSASRPTPPPVEAIRFQTHNGDGVPLGLYQDVALSIPSTQPDDDVKGWRSVDGLYSWIWPSGATVPKLQFVNDAPVIRNASGGRLVGTGWNLNPRTIVAGVRAANSIYQPILSASYAASAGLGVYCSTEAFYDWPASAMIMLGGGYEPPNAPRAIGAHDNFSATDLSVISYRFGQLRFDHANITTTVTSDDPTGPFADFNLFWDGSGAYLQGDMVALYISEEDLSNADVATLEEEVQTLIDGVPINPAAKYLVAMVGNSLTFGYGLGSPLTESLPAQLQALLGDEYHVLNLGVSSIQTPTITANMAAINSYATYKGWPWVKTIANFWEVSNHMALGAATPADAATALEACCNAAVGWDSIVVMDVLPRDAHGIDAEDRGQINGLISANYTSYADALYSVGESEEDTISADGANLSTTYYNADGIHTNADGVAIEAAGLAPFIITLATS